MEKTLKQIAFELLEKYEEQSETVIYEFSGSIYDDLEDLAKEAEDYKRAIEAAN